MKWESDEMPNRPKNVMISKWLPQADVLAHPNLKLFITHGGQHSLEEAIDRTIPMIAIPLLGDQDSNAIKISQRKIGVHLELISLSEEKLRSAIMEVLKPEYKKNIEKIRELVYDQPISSLDKATWWIEYVIRHKGTKHLEYVGTKIQFYQQCFFDIIAILILSILAVYKILSISHGMLKRADVRRSKTE